MEWQPIETAPRDGTFVLVFSRDEIWDPGDQDSWVAAYDGGMWWYSGFEYAVYPEPTHWMPLPSPPEGAE